LIELTGIPGSGKTKVAPIIQKHLKKSGFEIYDKHLIISLCKEFPLNKNIFIKFTKFFPIKIRSKISGLFFRILNNKQIYMAKYLLENRKFCETTMNDISESPIPSKHKNLIVLWWLNLISTYQIALESLEENSNLILDEGFFHKVINFYVYKNDNLNYSKMQAYIESIPEIDVLVRIETSLDMCFERLKNRKLPRVIKKIQKKR
jgi:hypothetical protein